MSLGRLRGSCHCGAVRYSVRLDLTAPTIRCNCTICASSRAWIASIAAADFTLEAGIGTLGSYRFGSGAIAHRFCARCGVKTHGLVGSGAEASVAVCVATLDLAPEALAALPVVFADGRHDAMDREPEVTSYL